ncbi:MAG: V4R domain-containing protein [Nannocystaceae bacterium]
MSESSQSAAGEPRLHNHYTKQRFLRWDGVGRLFTRTDQRMMLVSEDFVVGFQVALDGEVGDAAAEIMYRCGLEWGRRDFAGFARQFEAEFEKPVNAAPIEFVLTQWWWPLQAAGWGGFRFDLSRRGDDLIFVDLFESAIAKSIGNIGKVACHYYAGLFAAVFGAFADHPLSSIEIQCYSMGEEFCKFLIGSSKRINAAQFWVREGATAAEVIDRL